MMWNKRSTGLILLTSTEVDSTGASYYGKQALHFMSTRGDSFAVQLSIREKIPMSIFHFTRSDSQQKKKVPYIRYRGIQIQPNFVSSTDLCRQKRHSSTSNVIRRSIVKRERETVFTTIRLVIW